MFLRITVSFLEFLFCITCSLQIAPVLSSGHWKLECCIFPDQGGHVCFGLIVGCACGLYINCNFSFVLDGWPSTKSQVDLLVKFHITPVCVVEMSINEAEVLKRGKIDRCSVNRYINNFLFFSSTTILTKQEKKLCSCNA